MSRCSWHRNRAGDFANTLAADQILIDDIPSEAGILFAEHTTGGTVYFLSFIVVISLVFTLMNLYWLEIKILLFHYLGVLHEDETHEDLENKSYDAFFCYW